MTDGITILNFEKNKLTKTPSNQMFFDFSEIFLYFIGILFSCSITILIQNFTKSIKIYRVCFCFDPKTT